MINRVINGKYRILQRLGEDYTSVVYAADDTTNNSVVVRLLKKESSSNRLEDYIRFKNDVRTASQLEHPNIQHIIDIANLDVGYAIITTAHDVTTLRNHIDDSPRDGPDIMQALRIATQISDALQSAHRAHLIHGLINPSNILIENGAGSGSDTPACTITLTGFGQRHMLEFWHDTVERDRGPVQYLARYTAPEIIRHDRGQADERCDLYSTGVLLYELVTGKPSVAGDDLNEIFYQQLTKIPEPPSHINPLIEPALDRIIAKLLSKNPDDRYQSALGLMSDLKKYTNGNRDFLPGLGDKISRLTFHTGLTGRKHELQQLMDAYTAAMSGRGMLCCITGEEGVGKTRMAREMQGIVAGNAGIYSAGSCFAGEGNQPYGPLLEVLEHYVKFYNSHVSADKTRIKNAVKKFDAAITGTLLGLCPNLATLLDESPKPVKIAPDREKRRFIQSFAGFLGLLAELEDGLVIVLDDLQWADDGTLDVLSELGRTLAKYPLLLIANYREDALPYNHPLRTLVKSGKDSHAPIVMIRLVPLTNDDTTDFVAGLLYRDRSDPAIGHIAEKIFNRCGGNPFFCIESLKNSVSEGVIYFNEQNILTVDQHNLESHLLPRSIAEILEKRIRKLDDEAIEILSTAAAIGRRFTISFLLGLYAGNPAEDSNAGVGETIIRIIDAAVLLNLVMYDPGDRNLISFVHDSIRDSLYNTIDPAQRHILHCRIAETLEKSAVAANPAGASDTPLVFDLALHYQNSDNTERAFHYAYHAGIRAMNSHTYTDAIKYLSNALLYLERDAQSANIMPANDRYRIEIVKLIAGIFLVIGRYDESIDLFRKLLADVDDPYDTVSLYKGMSEAYFKKGDWKNCEEYARTGMRLMGESLPLRNYRVGLSIAYEIISHLVSKCFRIFPRFRLRNPRQIERYRLIMGFYYSLVWSYTFNDTLKFFRTILRMTTIASRRIGKSRELAMSYAFYAMLHTRLKMNTTAMRYHRKSIDLHKIMHDTWGLAQSYQLQGFSYFFMGSLAQALDNFTSCIELFQGIGDIKEVESSLLGRLWVHIILGDSENRRRDIEQYHDIAVSIKDNFAISYSYFLKGGYYLDAGDDEGAFVNLNTAYDIAVRHDCWSVACWAEIELGRYFLYHNVDTAITHLVQARAIYEGKRLMQDELSHLYVKLADAYAEKISAGGDYTADEKRDILDKMREASALAHRKNRRLPLTRGNGLRVMARYYSLKGRHRSAVKFFKESISAHKRIGYKSEHGIALFDFGLYRISIGEQHEGSEMLLEAYQLFLETANHLFLNRVRQHLAIQNTDSGLSISKFFKKQQDDRRVSLIMNFIKNLDADLALQIFLDRALAVITEITGADTGSILLLNEQDDFITIAKKQVNPASAPSPSLLVIREAIESGIAIFPATHAADHDTTDCTDTDKRSIICVPIKSGDKVLGVSYLANSIQSGMFSERDVESLRIINHQIALKLSISSLKRNVDKVIDMEPNEAFCAKYQITRREKEIILLLMQGIKRNEMREMLDISWGTINSHISNIFAKTGVNSKIELLNLLRKETAE